MKFNHIVWNSRRALVLGLAIIFGTILSRVEADPVTITETNDFSGNAQNPTVISPILQPGTNVIRGSVEAASFNRDEDYFRITLAPDSWLAGIVLTITNYSSTDGGVGLFEVLPTEDGNSGTVVFATNTSQVVSFVIGTPTNIILHVRAPDAPVGGATFCNYEVDLIVAPIEVVGGTAIYRAVEITFPSETGQHYQLQYTSDPNSDTWANLGTRMLGDGGTMSAFDTTRHADQRFYRVVKN